MTAIASPESALQKAIVDLLRADAGVIAAVGVGQGGPKVYDEIPADQEGPKLPWLYMGPINATDLDSGDGVLIQVRARIYAASNDGGRLEVWNIIHAARKALHLKEPPIVAPFERKSMLRVTQTGDIIDPLKAKEAFLDVTCVMLADTSTFQPS